MQNSPYASPNPNPNPSPQQTSLPSVLSDIRDLLGNFESQIVPSSCDVTHRLRGSGVRKPSPDVTGIVNVQAANRTVAGATAAEPCILEQLLHIRKRFFMLFDILHAELSFQGEVLSTKGQAPITATTLPGANNGQAGFKTLKRTTAGLPSDANLKQVIYVFESQELPDIADGELFNQPSFTVCAKETVKPVGPPYDGKPCPMCPMEIRSLAAVVHNLVWRLEPGAGTSSCKISEKFHDMKRAVGCCSKPAIDAPEAINNLYEAALAASTSSTIDELRTFLPRLKEASGAVQVLTDLHFANRSHSHGS